ncbi:hypothetical protein HUG10_07520 [Halorarum halophilum]|uniref:Uncharacterized protein n=1 Tax=Halorarum halophilum TaxID=2743090 RepID=A0A7D5GBJ7_9EURY|nr:hypothetical protein [Halobaculum halophilum]QLG27405.1 hypothetical protein HUG10_07520 [Halobaculum halophilum]
MTSAVHPPISIDGDHPTAVTLTLPDRGESELRVTVHHEAGVRNVVEEDDLEFDGDTVVVRNLQRYVTHDEQCVSLHVNWDGGGLQVAFTVD